MKSATVIAFQAVVMFILLFCGYFLYKKKMLSADATKQLSNITISIINPIVIFNAYQTDFNPILLRGLLWSLGLSFVSHIVLILAARLAIKKGSKNSEIERFAISYSNCAFMGIPLIESAFGSEGVFFLTGYITMFNLFMWTHGVVSMSDGEKKPPKETLRDLLKILCSPAILSIALGLVFFFTGLRLPGILSLPLNYLGSMNTPLAMLVSGATIAKAGLFDAFKKGRAYYVQALKLIILPLILTALFVPMQYFGADRIVINTVLVAAAAPTASATIMFAYKFGKDPEYASHHFALSTVLSCITLPLTLLLSDLFSSALAL